MKNTNKSLAVIAFSLVLFFGCTENKMEQPVSFKVDYEKFTLDNGLEVVLHTDYSDPVVAVALTAHVGSAREIEGRTGFAHLFEHLLFLESENLGKGGLDQMSARIGGSGANGSTSRDRTNYFQTVPMDALEKMIWAEADKLGWFISTVTDEVLAKEKQVVKNEKRQSGDNQPYGHNSFVIDKQLYPSDHPYNWQVIGSLEDLQNATLQDVKDFFNRWYVPNNVTLVIAGNFDPANAKTLIKKYFDEIPSGEAVMDMPIRPGVIAETVKLYHEDNFARVPQLTMVWPTVELYHPDSYALNVLSNYLTRGKSAPFYKTLVVEQELTSNTSMFNRTSEIAGQLYITIRAYADKDLDDVEQAVNEAFATFESDGISQEDLDRIKAGQETAFYNGLNSVLGKGFELAQYNIFADNPGFVENDVNNILAVTTEDVENVYNKYIKGQNFIATSFVPRGRLEQALAGSTKAEVVEEKIVQGAEETFDASIQAEYDRTPSTFDRTQEPASGPTPNVEAPQIWEGGLVNGLKIYGIENSEVPLVSFNIILEGGLMLDKLEKVGVANLVARLMTQGTKNKTPEVLEQTIQQLGASISIRAGKESISISGNTLARNYYKTVDLVEEMILEPRWDQKEFQLIKQSVISSIRQQEANPNAVANNAYNLLLYGEDNILSQNILGSERSVNAITLEDLKLYYENNISPSIAKMHVVGDINQGGVMHSLKGLNTDWKAKQVTMTKIEMPTAPAQSQVYFYDIPDAKQSVLNFGYAALKATNKDYYPASVMNYILGGGGFASQLTQQLREGKGYTYGIGSRFSGSKNAGAFTISSGVRSNVSYESAQLVKDIVSNYGKDFSERDLEVTKGFLIKSNARALETSNSKLNMLQNISTYGWAKDYAKQREQIVKNMTIAEIQALAHKYLNTDKMVWLVVGDAKTQMKGMEKLGFGKPILINDMAAPENK
jgi:zinc protease